MTAGRKPIPTKLKIVKGTAQPCRIIKDEAKPKSDAVRMPAGLSDDAKKQWKIAAKHLTAAGLLTNLDTFALAMYCEVFARWTYANDQIKKFGPIVKAPSGYPVQSPFFTNRKQVVRPDDKNAHGIRDDPQQSYKSIGQP
mgnify:CR=1 FL=1